MQIDFYVNFSKRINSTKQPTVGGLVDKYTVTGHIKEPCNALHPVISLQNPPVENFIPLVCTYAYIPAFFRYYFVRNWEFNGGLWIVSLDVDVLATYKTHIGETSAYIERCAAEYSGKVMDKLYPAKVEAVVTNIAFTPPWVNKAPSQGCYVLGVISGSGSNTTGSAVTYYALTFSQMIDLLSYLLGTGGAGSDAFLNDEGFSATISPSQQLSQNVAKCFINPKQYIASCMWFPFSATAIGESTPRKIMVGNYKMTSSVAMGYWISDTVYGAYATSNVPFHPDALTRGAFLNYYPYTQVTCFLPPFGSFPIDTFYLGDDTDHIEYHAIIDLATGKATLRVSKQVPNGEGTYMSYLIYETSAMFGVPIQLAQVSSDILSAGSSYLSAIGGIAGAVGGIAMGHPMAAASGGLMFLQSIGNAFEAQRPQVSSNGANGSFAAFRQSAWLSVKYQKLVDDDNTENGRPLCQVRRIDTLPGFIRCGEVTVDYTAFKDELEQIHEFLTTGFFWE